MVRSPVQDCGQHRQQVESAHHERYQASVRAPGDGRTLLPQRSKSALVGDGPEQERQQADADQDPSEAAFLHLKVENLQAENPKVIARVA
jgi:hypothetical protein